MSLKSSPFCTIGGGFWFWTSLRDFYFFSGFVPRILLFPPVELLLAFVFVCSLRLQLFNIYHSAAYCVFTSQLEQRIAYYKLWHVKGRELAYLTGNGKQIGRQYGLGRK